MQNITFEQRQFIRREYNLLHAECIKFYDNNDLSMLQFSRIRLNTFIKTIESLFNIDMYCELLPSLN